jgi:hypothetical protein
LIQLPPVALFRHGAVDPAKQVPLIFEEPSSA